MSRHHHLSELPPTPESHFRLHVYAAILRLRGQIPPPDEHNGLGFMSGYFAELDAAGFATASEDAQRRWDALVATWEAGAPGHLPLRALRHACGLDALAMTLLFSAGLVEEDLRFGKVFEALNGVPGEPRPTFGLLSTWTPDDGAGDAVHALLATGLLAGGDPGVARSRWPLQVPPELWDAMRRRPVATQWARHRPASELMRAEELILPVNTTRALDRLPALLHGDEPQPVIVRGPSSSGRRTLLGALARSLDRGVLELADPAAPLAGPLATLLHAIPVVELRPAPGETIELPRLAAYRGPVGVILGRHGGVRASQQALTLTLGIPAAGARARHWAAAVGADPAHADELGGGFRIPAGTIRAAGALARTQAALNGRARPATDDVLGALRTLHTEALETLATRVTVHGDWSDLAVADETARELGLLETRCRHRERLRDSARGALSTQLTPGVRVLLSGPSGTGKTLAARLLASVLRKELYALDLSSVVNKYIGETEKNLDAVFTRAEELDVVLLLDEGDALMTRRTDVQSANDRYANLETNFLLQRLEAYEGILVVSTNAGDRIDGAFRRRMDVVVEFRAPDAIERWQIWQLHLPPSHAVEASVLDELAGRCVLTGGQIRNAVLHASLLALDGSDRDGGAEAVVTGAHVEEAVRREYRKAGLVCPLRAVAGMHVR
jgi:energy-coupling factor transporter ATP-binding protein EcfA2